MTARGLTIIELLAATVLLAVLAAATLPVVRSISSEDRATPVEPRLEQAIRMTVRAYDEILLAETARSSSLVYTDPDGVVVEASCDLVIPQSGRGTLIVIRHDGILPVVVWSSMTLEEEE